MPSQAKRTPAMTKVALARLADRRLSNGFLRMDDRPGPGSPDEVPWTFADGIDDISGEPRSRSVAFERGGASWQATLLVRENESDYECGLAQTFSCTLRSAEGNVQAYLNGILITSRGIYEPLELVNCADCVSDDALECVNGLLEQAEPYELFENGALLLVTMWERSSHAPAGAGLAAFDGLARLMRKRKTGVGTVCLLLDAFQYSDLTDNRKMADKGFLASMHKVRAHATRIEGEALFNPWARVMFVEPKAKAEGDVGLRTLARHAVEAGAYGPGHRAGIKVRNADLLEVERVDGGEPAIAKDLSDFPVDFDVVRAVGTLAFRPHREFWDYMPTEMMSLEGSYGPDDADGTPSVASLRIGFANGSTLDLDPEHLPGRPGHDVPPRAFVGSDDFVVRENAFTDRMGTIALAKILTRHLILAFDGDEREGDGFRVGRDLRQ